jgi:hypothetical protein
VDLVPLTGGGWGRIPMAWFDQHGERVADLLATRGDDHRVPIYALPDLAKLCAELDQPPPPELERLRPLLGEFTGIPATPAEGGFVGELRRTSSAGCWLVFTAIAHVLADDMGPGKTIQALAGSAAARSSCRRPACCSTGSPRPGGSGPICASRPTAARAASSSRAPTSC